MNVQDWLGADNQIGIDIYEGKYRHNNETFDEWLDRVSGGNEALRQLMAERKFLFGGRALANRGTGKKGSMFNCYSSGYAPDDIEGLMQLNTNLALTYKAQGGQGVSLSKIRPKGTPIGNEFTSDGIVPFMEIFNATTSSISQGGARKGALMMSLDIMHKEAETFITIKSNEDRITKANLSLEIDDRFMECVKTYYETGKVIQIPETRYYNGHKVDYMITPINLYKLMIETAYDWGEPACIFSNNFRNYNLMEFDNDYQIETCNPCGEQPLPKNFSCNLGSLNVSEFVENPYTARAKFNWQEFEKAIEIAVEALDTIIDENLNNHALKEQADNSKNYRNIGLGIMGYSNALFKLGLTYGSEEAIEFTDELFSDLLLMALETSCYLAQQKGAFPKCKPDKIVKSRIIQDNKDFLPACLLAEIEQFGLRNCSLISIAPTGSIATLLGLTGGCEPEFALSYTRRTDNLKDSYKIYCKSVNEYWEMTDNVIDKGNINSLPEYFVASADIHWKDRIDTQATMQKYVDTAISSTINLSKDVSLEEIEQIYLYAWEKNLKGITIFRDGCKRLGILMTDNNEDMGEEIKFNIIPNTHNDLPRGVVLEADDDAIGKKRKLITGCGSLHCVAFFDPITGDLLETYLSKGSTGGCANFMVGLSRMISLAARGGIPIESIIDQLDSCGTCPSYAVRRATKGDTSKGSCCPIAVGNALREMYDEMQSELFSDSDESYDEPITYDVITDSGKVIGAIEETYPCPDCGEPLVFEGGCNTCKACGYSKCD